MAGGLTRVVAGLVAGVVLVALWANTGQAERWWLAGLYSISVIVTPVGGRSWRLLRGRAIGMVEAAYDVLSKVALLGVGVATLAAGWRPSGVIGAFVLVDLVSSLLLPVVSARHLTLSKTPDPLQRAELRLRATLPLSAAGILGTAYERIDIWLLALLKGSSSVAIYVAAYKLYDTALLPAAAIASSAVAAAGPALETNARPTARRLATRATVIAAPIARSCLSPRRFCSEPRSAGTTARGRGRAVAILMVASLPGAALAAITPIALLCRRQLIVKWTVAGLVGNIVGNVVLVPLLGIRGAAVAFLITESILLVAFYRALPGMPAVAQPAASPVTSSG